MGPLSWPNSWNFLAFNRNSYAHTRKRYNSSKGQEVCKVHESQFCFQPGHVPGAWHQAAPGPAPDIVVRHTRSSLGCFSPNGCLPPHGAGGAVQCSYPLIFTFWLAGLDGTWLLTEVNPSIQQPILPSDIPSLVVPQRVESSTDETTGPCCKWGLCQPPKPKYVCTNRECI